MLAISRVIKELLLAIDPLWCLSSDRESNKNKMKEAFENAEVCNSEIYNDLDLDSYKEEGLFIILKTLLWAMDDAYDNEKVFIYAKWEA